VPGNNSTPIVRLLPWLACAWLLAPGPVRSETLTARDALLRAVRENYDVRIVSLSPEVAQGEIAVEEGKFLPSLFADANYEDNLRSQNAIDFSALQQRRFSEENLRLKGGVGNRLPWGTTVELSLSAERFDNSINRLGPPNALFSPEFDMFGGVTISQPLLKGFGRAANLADLRVARSQLVIAGRERQVAIVNTCVAVLNAFYDLAYAQSNVALKQEALSVAQRFVAETARRQELGLLGPVDVSQARVRESEAREEWIQAQDFQRERRAELARLLGSGLDGAGAVPEIVVSAELLDRPPTVTRAELFPRALELRPDYLELGDKVDQEGLRRAAAANARLPELNVRFSYGLHGLADSYGHALDHVYGAAEPAWGGGISVTLPLSPREGRGRLAAARTRVRQAELRREQLGQRIELDIENGLRRLEVLSQRLATARSSVSFATEGLKLEEARLTNGQTSAFAVADLQRRLADARTREIAARVDLTKAVAELWSVSGRLLTSHDIEVAAVAPPSRPRFNAFALFDRILR
jgi:outer membrane protein TolC